MQELFHLLEFLAGVFQCHVHYFQCWIVYNVCISHIVRRCLVWGLLVVYVEFQYWYNYNEC